MILEHTHKYKMIHQSVCGEKIFVDIEIEHFKYRSVFTLACLLHYLRE
jgi:hypothetical protein